MSEVDCDAQVSNSGRFLAKNDVVTSSLLATQSNLSYPCKMKWKLCILTLHASFSRAFRNLLQTQTTPKDGLTSYFTRINSVTFTTRHYMNSASPQSTALERSDSDILMKEVESVLLPKLFGHPKFRPGQREVITKVLTGYNESRTTSNIELYCTIFTIPIPAMI